MTRGIIHLYFKAFCRGWTMGACSYFRYRWSGVSKGSDGKSAGGRRYSSVPLYLRIVPLLSSRSCGIGVLNKVDMAASISVSDGLGFVEEKMIFFGAITFAITAVNTPVG